MAKNIIPVQKALTNMISSEAILGVAFCATMFNLFINIHHYFIDNVIWRFDNAQMRERMF